jgi:hypothetical protein
MDTESLLPPEKLRFAVRRRVEDGRLPSVRPGTVVAGYGDGDKCSACDRPLRLTDVVYEIAAGRRTLKFHIACYSIWQQEVPP